MTDAAVSSLLLPKITVPAVRPRLIPRTRLLERLRPDAGAGLILVCAPAGYGKTTLLAEWARSLRERDVAVAWYAIDPGDDDPVLFCDYLLGSLEQALGPTAGRAFPVLFPSSSPDGGLQKVLPNLINYIATEGRECLLVLDDYQWIGSSAIHEAVAVLLEHLPERMRVAVGTRSDPPLPLARMRARGTLAELRAESLRFTRGETARFLTDVMRVEPPEAWIDVLEKRTEGWIAGLQLAALSLKGVSDRERAIRAFDGRNRFLADYYLEEVFRRQREPVQTFLLSTSILDRFSASLCDAVTDFPGGSAALLETLERGNLFVVALDDRSEWYRYHSLFREFLQARLYKSRPQSVPELQRYAAEWHSREGHLREAVRHALASDDWEFAAAIVERHGASMMMRGEASAVSEWCAAFPEEVIRRHPAICIFQSNALLLRYRKRHRPKIRERLEQIEQAAAAMEDRQTADVLMGQAATIRVFLEATTVDPAADPRRQFILAEKALECLSEDDPARSAVALTIGYAHMALEDARAGYEAMEKAKRLSTAFRNYYGIAEAGFYQARLLQAQGRLRKAEILCREGREEFKKLTTPLGSEPPAAGCFDIALGAILLERDRLDEAERCFLHGVGLTGWGMNPFYQMTAYMGVFRLREIQGRPEEARAFLDRMEEAWPDIDFLVRGLRIAQALRNRPVDARLPSDAEDWDRSFSWPLDRADFLPGMGPLGAAETYYQAYLIRARIAMGSGRASQALAYLDRQVGTASDHGLTQRIIELSLLQAQALHAEGKEREGWDALEKALALAQPEEHLHIFNQGPPAVQLLEAAAKKGIHRDYIGRILAGIEAAGSPQAGREGKILLPASSPANPLTEREMDVLQLMARGVSNQEIAEQLVITLGTVKSHVNHILNKLEARNRTAAVARARSMRLLDR